MKYYSEELIETATYIHYGATRSLTDIPNYAFKDATLHSFQKSAFFSENVMHIS